MTLSLRHIGWGGLTLAAVCLSDGSPLTYAVVPDPAHRKLYPQFLTRLTGGNVPGEWTPGTMATSGHWAVVSDERNARLVHLSDSRGADVGGVDKNGHP